MHQQVLRWLYPVVLLALLSFGGCTSVSTFPHIARPGDTVSMMVGGSAKVRKQDVSATLTDAGGHVYDLKALGLVRSVFNLRTDGRAYGLHYSPYNESAPPWIFGHEPLQTMLVTDIPLSAVPGQATLTVTLNNVMDDSTGNSGPVSISMEILSGVGNQEQFLTGESSAVDFSRLETAPYAEIIYTEGIVFTQNIIGAASLVIDFDENVVNPGELNVYVPEAILRKESPVQEPFGKTQRMVYWHQDGQKLYVDILAPQGILAQYLKVYVMHPRGLSGSPGFNLLSAQTYDTSGNLMSLQPRLNYSP